MSNPKSTGIIVNKLSLNNSPIEPKLDRNFGSL